jgi:hypothetical protein
VSLHLSYRHMCLFISYLRICWHIYSGISLSVSLFTIRCSGSKTHLAWGCLDVNKTVWVHPNLWKMIIYEFLTGVTMKNTGFSSAALCSSEGAWHFGGANQRKIKQHWEAESPATLPPDSAAFLFGLLFDPENGGDMFLRNFGFSPTYKALQPRTLYSSLRTI